jgi:hypothetical protein
MARVRSPNFPVMGLPDALNRIDLIYDREQTVPADRETLAEHLGYSGLNGASLKQLSALIKYGLLEDAGDKRLRVSKLAMAIMHPASEQEKADAIREAAQGPALFRHLEEQFDGQRPSETNLRSWLLRNGFSKSAVDSVIKAYNETMDLVDRVGRSYSAPTSSVIPTATKVRSAVATAASTFYGGGPAIPAMPPGDPFSVEMMKGRVRVVGELSNKGDAKMLMDFLRMAIAFLPEKGQDSSPLAEDTTQASDWDEDEEEE